MRYLDRSRCSEICASTLPSLAWQHHLPETLPRRRQRFSMAGEVSGSGSSVGRVSEPRWFSGGRRRERIGGERRRGTNLGAQWRGMIVGVGAYAVAELGLRSLGAMAQDPGSKVHKKFVKKLAKYIFKLKICWTGPKLGLLPAPPWCTWGVECPYSMCKLSFFFAWTWEAGSPNCPILANVFGSCR